MQAPIRFTSAIPGAIAQRQGDQQALQQFFDRNKVEKARMEQIKSLKQLAKGYGASAAQVESSSYGELQGFVQRMELERADKTRKEQTRLRELQMQQAQQDMGFARQGEERKEEERLRQAALARFLTTGKDPELTRQDFISSARFLGEASQGPDENTMGLDPFDPDVRRGKKKLLPPSFYDPKSYERTPAPMELGPSDRFQRIASDPNLDPRSKMEAMNQAKAEAMAQQKFALEQQKAGMSLTPGETSFDQTFAKSLVEFNEPDVRKGMEQLRGAINSLENSNTLSGPVISLLPNFIGDRVNPDAAQTREAIEEVVQRNLRLVLGAQFTEREGERLISRAYNPRLEEEQNIERVQRLFKSIEDAMNAKLSQKAYFQRYGTLKGHRGLEAEAAFWGSLGDSPSQASGQPSAGGATSADIEALRREIERKTALEVERATDRRLSAERRRDQAPDLPPSADQLIEDLRRQQGADAFRAPMGSSGLPPSTPQPPKPIDEVLKDVDKLIQGFGPGQ